MNRNNKMDSHAEYILHNAARWRLDFFDSQKGGYLVVDNERIEQSKVNKQEMEKYKKEYNMCLTLAQNGYKVEYLKMTENSFDIYLNGISTELKKTTSHNNLVDYAKKAVNKQEAKLVVFELETMNAETMKEMLKLKVMNIPVKYYLTNDKTHIIDL
ncbi:hypothetical protein AGMMS4956_20240 [Bacteroidia bacterium]|nr:hypothetical protein AGMMS4956_20240 [Bacteroidia bacterium]